MVTYSTSQIAKIAGLHPNTVRRYEEWGLIQKPERKKNGYRVYNDIHMEGGLHRSGNDILNILNTPDDEEDIISACDRLIDSLEKAIENAYEVILLLFFH